MVSTSMPEKPKALSPSMAITGSPVSTAAATAKPMPIPIMPQVPTSRRFLGLNISTMLRVKSSVLAPSFTSMASGLALMISRTTFNALWKFIGVGSFAKASAILARFLFLRSVIALSHSAGGLAQPAPAVASIPASNAETQEPISPTTGASIRTLLSISVGEISIWMYVCPPHAL